MSKFLLIISSLVITLIYSFSIHPFEVPDENAHFSSLIFLDNQGRMPTILDQDNLTLEELETEKIFGIVEHQNKYSYHPEFRMEYSSDTVGLYEEKIKSFNTESNRTTYDTYQAATYPALYYWITLPFYNLVKSSDILTRLYISRLSSVILTLLLVFTSYHIGNLVFKSKKYGYTLAVMTLFFPMTTYIGAGVNSDNLHNLLFSSATLLALKLIKDGWSHNLSLLIGTVIGLDLITKPQGYILIPIIALAVVIRWQWGEWRSILSSLFYLLTPIFLLAGWQELPKLILGNSTVGVTSYTARVVEHGGLENFKIFFSGYLRTHLTEMIVWYWGVFKWFGVILPRPLWWIGTRLIGLSVIGLTIKFYQDFRSRRLSGETRFVIFALGANLIYIAALGWFDWQFYQEYGRSLGLQPRYYMPLLISQLALILMGLTSLSWNETAKEWIRRGVIFFFLGLQLTSFYVQLKSYYDLVPVSTLINQISQYKPWFAKGSWWYLWFPLYFAGIITTFITVIKSEHKK